MDDNKSPEDILDEIMNRPYASPAFDPTSLDDIPPPSPETRQKAGSPKLSAQLFPWLCMALGVALLALGVCVFRLVVLNARLDELRQAEADAQSADSLREENDQLRQDVDEMQNQISELQRSLKDIVNDAYSENRRGYLQQTELKIRMQRSEYLSFLQRFIDSGDLPMAAIVMVLENEYLRGMPEEWWATTAGYYVGELPGLNTIQQERYDSYRDILVEEGLLEEREGIAYDYWYSSVATMLFFTEPWDTGTNQDMADLATLWCILDWYYVQDNVNAAAQHLTQLSADYYYRLSSITSEDTVRLLEQLIYDMIEKEYLVEQEGGTLDYHPDFVRDLIYYSLPFAVPGVPE